MSVPKAKLDAIDAAIVTLLQEDGRRPYGEIGEAVGLSEAATRQRVNRLRESGLMRIVAVTDPVALGRGVIATVGLRISGDTRDAAARLAQIAEAEYVVVTAGAFDVIVELVCATEDDLLDVLNDEIRSLEAVREMETFMHLRTEKNVFAWGQRLGEE
ncbi:MAG: Lrp/AsnC family transcriptional regulator [Solirubrobacteraceae bacterium]